MRNKPPCHSDVSTIDRTTFPCISVEKNTDIRCRGCVESKLKDPAIYKCSEIIKKVQKSWAKRWSRK